MTKPIPEEMVQAVRLTRQGRLTEATAFIQRLLRGGAAPSSDGRAEPLSPQTIELTAADVTSTAPRGTSDATTKPKTVKPSEPRQQASARQGTAKIFDGLPSLKVQPSPPEHLAPAAGSFIAGSINTAAGQRSFKLYIPSIAKQSLADLRPLVIMLHGCTQSADDFAAGTRMNFAAESEGSYVAYPEQIASANASKCWNWFDRSHQSRDQGEPAIIAALAQQLIREHRIDPQRVYIAGLSAGGAAAVVAAEAYPDIFAAVGVHSGLACGVARDMTSAFTAMQGRHGSYVSTRETLLPTIVFHGDADKTVHPRNGADVVAGAAGGNTYRREVEQGGVVGGRNYTRSIQHDGNGLSVIEDWVIHGGGHAWSGGSPAGSFTDPRGPDASAEMLRFFLTHSRPR